MKISGIYKIQSKLFSNRFYIGSSSNIGRRWNCHKSRLLNNYHHSIKLQRHVNKYGIIDIEFCILKECPISDLIRVEQLFLDIYEPYFNCCKIAGSTTGIPSSTKGKHLSEEHKAKLRKPKSEEHKRKLSESRKGIIPWNKGIPHSRETKEKIRLKRLGVPPANKGKKMSQEIIERSRLAHKGLVQSEQTRLNRSRTFSIKRIRKYILMHELNNFVFNFSKDEVSVILEGLNKLYLKYPEENISNVVNKFSKEDVSTDKKKV